MLQRLFYAGCPSVATNYCLTMKFIEALHLLTVICLLSSCGTQYAYFQTPFHTNASAYKTQPQVRDSVRSAVYASGAFTIGGANHHSRDDVMGFMGSIYRAHSGRHIQGYYGITGVLGQYKIEKYQYAGSTQNQYDNLNLNDSLINLDAGYHSFAGWGAVGGLNWVLPFRNWEWRALGVEASWLHEYGSYLKFRQQLPDTAANILDRRNRFFTIGLNTDFVFYARKGSGGIKMGTGP